MEVSEIFLCKSLGEHICNLVIYMVVLQNYGPVMHQLPNVVHVNLYMFGPLPSNWIYGDLKSTFIVTKYDTRQSNTKIKL